ncbi:hypothetical protein CVIRNUC_004759 [Coccomyxa viridis]|uniref:Peptidase S54 rhomboid domain-containing protein n=1 Tax=Coccomyxa viridis TaxID=1274662 RepID=A0AAV1I3E6_9CHLO|nr:hypothetical protein CVIRNUC_004759 [Coccomyxa viridis]
MDGSNVPQQASANTRVRAWLSTVPLSTRAALILCVGLYLFGILTGLGEMAAVCLNAHLFIDKLQIYRMLTAPFFHVGILHLAFNMLAFVPIGQSLERHTGTLHFTYLMLLLMALGSVFYLTTSLAWDTVMLSRGAYSGSCAVGLSGLVFGLIAVDNAISGVTQRSIFGFFTVPAKAYPWALLVFWQLLMPAVSFWGHLGGLLAGELFVRGWLKALVPSEGSFQRAEGAAVLAPARRWECYMAHTGGAAFMALPTSYSASSPADSSPVGPSAAQQGPSWMRGIGQIGRPGGQGSATYSSAGGAGPSAQAIGQGGSFLSSLGMGGQPADGQKGAGETSFKGKAHTLGSAPTVAPSAAAAVAAAARMAPAGQRGAGSAKEADAASAQPGR